MFSTMEGLNVRQARHEDYEAVMDINRDVYEGMDYFHSMYHHYLRYACCYVAEIKGQVLSFVAYYPVDEGRRAVSVGARTRSDFQHSGLTKQFMGLAFVDFLKKYPRIEILSWASENDQYYEKLSKKPDSGVHIIRKWHALFYNFNMSSKPPVVQLREDFFKDITLLKKHDVQQLSEDRVNMEMLFGGHLYIEGSYNWFPLPINRASLEQLEREGNMVVSQRPSDGKFNVLSFSNNTKTQNGVCLLIHLRHSGGTIESVAKHLLYHVYHSLKVAPPCGSVLAVIDIPLDLDRGKVEALVKPFIGQTIIFEGGVNYAITGDNDILNSKL